MITFSFLVSQIAVSPSAPEGTIKRALLAAVFVASCITAARKSTLFMTGEILVGPVDGEPDSREEQAA